MRSAAALRAAALRIMMSMKSVRAGLPLVIALLLLPLMVHGQADGTTGTQTEGGGIDTTPIAERCAPIGPYEENQICHFKEVDCEDGKKGLVISKCIKSQCTGVESCGKPLKDVTEIPDGPDAPEPTPSQPVPSGPATTNPFPSSPVPSGSGGTAGSGSGFGGNVPNPVPSTQLPPIEVVQPRPGTTFNSGGSPFTLDPTRPSGTLGSPYNQSPGNVYGDPFQSGSNTTFGSYFGSGSAAGPAGNLISAIVGNLVSNLFGGLFGGSSNSGGSPSTPSTAIPTPRPVVVADASSAEERARLREERLRLLNESRGTNINTQPPSLLDSPLLRDPLSGFSIVPLQSSGRVGLPLSGTQSLTGGSPQGTLPPAVINDALNPSGLPQEDLQIDVPPRVVVDASGLTDVSPELPIDTPEWWSPRMLSDFAEGFESGLEKNQAYQRARLLAVESAFAGLAGGRIGAGDAEVDVARHILEDDVNAAEYARDSAYDRCLAPCFGRWIDRNLFSVTAEQRALDDARARLALLGEAEGRARLGQYAGQFEPEPPPASPFAIAPGVYVQVVSPEEFDAIAGETLTQSPQTQTTAIPETMLEGISRIGARVRDAAQAAASRVGELFGINTTTPADTTLPVPVLPTTPQATETPAPPAPPETPPAPQPTPTQVSTQPMPPQTTRPAFIQSGVNLLSAFVQGVVGFFIGRDTDSNDSARAAQPSQPAEPSASAAITANPPTVPEGGNTVLSWSSVGTLGCAVVDSELSTLVRGGGVGTFTSPSITTSTRFGIICDIEGGRDKFINETLVRVEGDESEPERLFAQTGRASRAAPVSDSGSTGSSTSGGEGQTTNPQPIDVRTCDPEQDINSFIRCLCEAEPNPNGCLLVP